jgi:RNA polymerase sigma-70 factor (ECF subfamily)
MNCKEIFEALSDYLDDDLDAEECDEIETHVEKCVPCQAFLNTLQRTVDFCRDATVESINDAQRAELRETLKLRYLEAVRSLPPRS